MHPYSQYWHKIQVSRVCESKRTNRPIEIQEAENVNMGTGLKME